LKRRLDNKSKELEQKVEEKKNSLTEEEAMNLLLEKFYNIMEEKLMRYLSLEKREIIKVFEKLWDKYSTHLVQIREERDREVKRLEEFLKELGVIGYEL
ncbi:MAG: N-6 DNA methylase, partial [Aquificaceae bacterium]